MGRAKLQSMSHDLRHRYKDCSQDATSRYSQTNNIVAQLAELCPLLSALVSASLSDVNETLNFVWLTVCINESINEDQAPQSPQESPSQVDRSDQVSTCVQQDVIQYPQDLQNINSQPSTDVLT